MSQQHPEIVKNSVQKIAVMTGVKVGISKEPFFELGTPFPADFWQVKISFMPLLLTQGTSKAFLSDQYLFRSL